MKQSAAVPEDLSTLSEEDLNALADGIREEAESLAADAAKDDAALAQIEKLVSEFDRINEEIEGRKQAEAARAERVAGALDKFNGPADPANPDDAAPEGDDVVEPIAAAVEPEDEIVPEVVETPAGPAAVPAAAAAVEAPATAAVTEAPAPAATPVPEAPATETLAVETPVSEEAPTPEVAVSAPTTPSTVTASLDAARPEALDPREDATPTKGAPFTATSSVTGVKEGQALSISELAQAITSKRHGMGIVSRGASERVGVGVAQTSSGFAVGGSEFDNFGTFDEIRKEFVADRRDATSRLARADADEAQALVASGGVCAPLAPSYEFFRLAEPINPVEGSLPVADAPRGGIRFITPPDFRDASGGVRVTTEAEDAAGYEGQDLPSPATNDTAPKPCVRVVCPPVEECQVDAVSQCVTFGNLNYRVFPEQVEAFLADLAVIFTQTKEVFYLDAIDAASTSVTVSPDYSAVRGITLVLLAAAANYRRRHHMPTEAVLSLYLPSWVVEFIKVDLINDHSLGLNFLGAGQAEVASVFASMNLDITFYYDSATGAGQAFDDAQDEGALNAFPESVVAYLFAPGTFVRLNGGTLEVGLVRDSVLNSTNDLQLFSEEWIQVCMVGLESLRLEITTCPTGTAPEPVAPLTCVGGSI